MTTHLIVATACAAALAGLGWFVCRGRSVEEGGHWALKALLVALIVVAPFFIVMFSLKLPVWSSPSPPSWDRPCFTYGFPVPSKFESAGGTRDFPGLLCLNWLFWTCYAMFLLGYRKWRSYLVAAALVAAVSGVLFGGHLFTATR